ncbi:hypothetical protein GC194_03550 [bacterium]|nr:hypothetical protein [bacterium]
MKAFKWVLIIFLLLEMAGCMAEPTTVDLNTVEHYPNFWLGLWHGIIAPVSFIISLFNKGIGIYQAGGSGWYDFGFLMGVSISFGGGGHSASRRNRRKKF